MAPSPNPILSFLRRHFATLSRRPKWTFLLQVWFEAVLFAYLTGNLLNALFHFPARTDLNQYTPLALLGMTIVVGPLFETLIFQCLPLELAHSLRWPRVLRFALSMVPFAIGHYAAGLPTVVSAGVVAGFFFAFTYERWRRESLVVAVIMTVLLHASFNLVGAAAMLFFPH